jgi:hypothetical protein
LRVCKGANLGDRREPRERLQHTGCKACCTVLCTVLCRGKAYRMCCAARRTHRCAGAANISHAYRHIGGGAAAEQRRSGGAEPCTGRKRGPGVRSRAAQAAADALLRLVALCERERHVPQTVPHTDWPIDGDRPEAYLVQDGPVEQPYAQMRRRALL